MTEDMLETLGSGARVVRNDARAATDIDGDFVTGLAVAATGARESEIWDCALAAEAKTVVHHHDAEQIVVVIEGELTVEIEGERRQLGVGDAVIMPEGTVHQLSAGAQPNRHLGINGKIGTKTILTSGEELEATWQD